MVAIERASFRIPWSERAFRELLRRRDAVLLGVEWRGRLAGYAVLTLWAGAAELADLAVDPSTRRRGLGRRLLRAVLGEAEVRGVRRVFLQVRESNRAALALYRSSGFRTVGRRPRYYHDPVEDALTLLREAGFPLR